MAKGGMALCDRVFTVKGDEGSLELIFLWVCKNNCNLKIGKIGNWKLEIRD